MSSPGTLERYPDIEWIFTHGGGVLPLLVDRLELFRLAILGVEREKPSVRERVARLWFDLAGTPFPRQVAALTAALGTDRLLYGSDYCWTPVTGIDQQVASIDAADQPEGDSWQALTTRNAERLLHGNRSRDKTRRAAPVTIR